MDTLEQEGDAGSSPGLLRTKPIRIVVNQTPQNSGFTGLLRDVHWEVQWDMVGDCLTLFMSFFRAGKPQTSCGTCIEP